MPGWAPFVPSTALRHTRSTMGQLNRYQGQLSSGSRIQRADDDAAGCALAAELRSEIRCGRQVQRNISDGLSVLHLADGGLQTISTRLVRARELAMQAASDTLGDRERAYLQEEMDNVLASIDETAKSTRWGNRLLISQVHADVGFLIDASGSMSGELASVRAALGDFVTDCTDAGVDVEFGLSAVGTDRVDGIRRLADIGSGTFTSQLASFPMTGGAQDPYAAYLQAAGAVEYDGHYDPDDFSWRSGADRHIIHLSDTGRETDQVPEPIPDDETSVGQMVGTESVAAHIIAPGFRHITFDGIAGASGGSLHDIGDSGGSGVAAAMEAIAEHVASLGAENMDTFDLQVGTQAEDSFEVTFPMDATTIGLGVNNLSVATRDDARSALDTIDSAISALSGQRAAIGADMNRLQIALNRQADDTVSMEEARSGIADTDVAKATAALARNQVLLDAGVMALEKIHGLNEQLSQRLLAIV